MTVERRATLDEFMEWLDTEDFGDDPDHVRREAWAERQWLDVVIPPGHARAVAEGGQR